MGLLYLYLYWYESEVYLELKDGGILKTLIFIIIIHFTYLGTILK